VVVKGVGDRSSPVADPSLVQGGESGACPWGVSGLWRDPNIGPDCARFGVLVTIRNSRGLTRRGPLTTDRPVLAMVWWCGRFRCRTL